jgi:hypothetical protein
MAEGLWMLVHAFPQRYVWIRQRARQPVDDHFTWPKVVTCIAHAYRTAVEGQLHATSRGYRGHLR